GRHPASALTGAGVRFSVQESVVSGWICTESVMGPSVLAGAGSGGRREEVDDPGVDRVGAFEMEEVADAVDDFDPDVGGHQRPRRLGDLDADASVVGSVEVQRRDRGSRATGRLDRVELRIAGAVAERGAVVAERG